MNDTSGIQNVQPSTHDHHRLASYTSNGINAGQDTGLFSAPGFPTEGCSGSSSNGTLLMKCNSRQSFWNKKKKVYLTTFIPLLTMALSILAVYDLAADSHDRITLKNRGSGELVLWVSETKENSIESAVIRGNTRGSTLTGDFSGQPGVVTAYADDRSPTLTKTVLWTKGVDTVRMRLNDINRISLSIWIVNGDFNEIKQQALEAWVRTSQIWLDERQGIEFISFDVKDGTGKTDSNGESVPDKFRSEPFNCGRASEIKDGIGFTPGAINVYYVETVEVEDISGGSFGEYCGSDDLIALGATSDDALLAHELGHAFTLEHIDHLKTHFDKTNVMHPASSERTFLTEGQTFRAIANQGSAINILYKTRPRAPVVSCLTSIDLEKHFCPPIQMRIWQDGGEDGTSWPPDN